MSRTDQASQKMADLPMTGSSQATSPLTTEKAEINTNVASASAAGASTLQKTEVARDIFTINNLLSAAQCNALIAQAQAQGFEPAPINTFAGTEVRAEVRNNERCFFVDHALAQKMWQQVRHLVPPTFGAGGHTAVGLNEGFRVYRYEPGQHFAWHKDGAYRRDNGEESRLTFMVYLNSEFEGGETRFLASGEANQGQTGQALVFDHLLTHEGAKVTDGVKYVIRSDVMYSAARPTSSCQVM
jgi:prolyl 4-hydroxylase